MSKESRIKNLLSFSYISIVVVILLVFVVNWLYTNRPNNYQKPQIYQFDSKIISYRSAVPYLSVFPVKPQVFYAGLEKIGFWDKDGNPIEFAEPGARNAETGKVVSKKPYEGLKKMTARRLDITIDDYNGLKKTDSYKRSPKLFDQSFLAQEVIPTLDNKTEDGTVSLAIYYSPTLLRMGKKEIEYDMSTRILFYLWMKLHPGSDYDKPKDQAPFKSWEQEILGQSGNALITITKR